MENEIQAFFEVAELSFSFPHSGGPLLKGLNLKIKRGETFGLIGPGGAGKTTLLKLIAGLLKPQKGEIRLAGTPNRDCVPVGMSFQKSGLFDSLSCGDNLRFPLLECTSLKRHVIELRVRESLAEVGLSGIENLRLHQISGGMQKRLGIARGLLLRPNLMLYDDPTAGLDPVTSRSIGDLISSVKKKYGMTVGLVTSDLNLAYRLSDRMGFLHRGELLQVSSVPEMRESKNPSVYQFTHGLLNGPLTAEGGR